ncbi:hypothetical protein L211DRAFT_889885 [Terfezia boudieri ATCC MYA-4762]|uniref:CCHC-type domain-containing protein n=1 Tax=Terfezia boudieri ATCC MYA-4762 TaxID=1051890 RepID=A0A3N4LIU5_9PEZI|nr:hypothetical protein L211DRAFT_889885 [Terfezia boudieri ATCC MYA-4762]
MPSGLTNVSVEIFVLSVLSILSVLLCLSSRPILWYIRYLSVDFLCYSASTISTNPANLDTFNDLALSLLSFGQTGNRQFRLHFTKQDFYTCRELLPSPCTLLSPVPGLGFPAEWVIDPSTFRTALKDLWEAFPEHYQEKDEVLEFNNIFDDGEFIRALPPSTNTVLRSRSLIPQLEAALVPQIEAALIPQVEAARVTKLPKPKDIVLKEVKDFDGSPANLSLFDTQIRNALNKLDIPAYYGGSVSGNEEEGYSYVAANAPEGKANYRLGEKLCSGISNKSLGQHHNDKKALGVVPFRGHVTRLCTRAGKAAWGSKCKAIRNTFPDWLKKQIKMTTKEEVFWEDVAASVNTELADRLDKTCSICLKPGHTAEECRKKDGFKEASKDKDGKDRKKKQCQFCGFEGHEIAECPKMKAAQQQLQQRQPFQGQSGQQQQQQQNQYNRRPLPAGFQQANQQGFQQANQQGFQQANPQGFRQANQLANPAFQQWGQVRPQIPTCYNCLKPGHISTNCTDEHHHTTCSLLHAPFATRVHIP